MASLIVASSYLPVPTGARFFTLKDDDVYYTLNGALSFSWINQSISNGRTYRNELPASYAGRAWQFIAKISDTTDTYIFGPPSPGNTFTTVSLTTTIDQISDMLSSGDDRFNATPPHDLPGMITLMVFWDGATGAGNVVAMCPAALFEQFSSAIPVRY